VRHIAILSTVLALSATNASAACGPSKPEAWEQFFANYSASHAFEVQRTKYPLKVLVWEYGVESGKDASAPKRSSVSRADYSKHRKSLSAHWLEHGMQTKLHSKATSAVVLDVFQENTDYSVLYHFRLLSGCWFLVQVENRSL
jgi:hypothetical protein